MSLIDLNAQAPLSPLWSHVDAFGAGYWYPLNDVHSTRVAYDPGTGRIYRAIMGTEWGAYYHVQVFDTEGTDLTPTPSLTLHGIDGQSDAEVTQIVHLSAKNDTLSAIVRYDDLYDPGSGGYFNWLKVFGVDGSPYFLIGSGGVAMNDFQCDATGTMVLTASELRNYGPTGWPNGAVTVASAERMAVLGEQILLGVPPSITRIDRSTLTALPPMSVPSSGTSTKGICIANSSSTFYYAALNSNGTMDVGLADINSGSIWSTTIFIPAQAEATAYHVDEQGDLWIAVAHNATGVATLGLLYRFHFSDGSYGVNSFSRRIDGIASSGTTLFLTGRVTGSTSDTYLAAFDIDLITDVPSTDVNALRIYPNPASTELRMDGLSPGTSRLTVTDVTGRFVKEMQGPFNGSMSIPVSDLPNGTYVLRSSGAGPTTMRSFSVLH